MTTKEFFDLILSYIQVILSWPVAFFVVSVIFIFKFRYSIKIFLENIASIKVGPFEASQHQRKSPTENIEDQVAENLEEQGIKLTKSQLKEIGDAFDNLSKEKERKDTEITNQGQTIKYLLERSELYEFSYLNLLLVQNSKNALLWFHSQFSNSSTKENFMAQYILPPQIVNPIPEREVIFNVLLVNGLLEQNGILFKISEKGVRFLKHVKLIN